jgi:hypothetical protein
MSNDGYYDPHTSVDFSKGQLKKDSPWDRIPKAEVAIARNPSELDSQENQDLHTKLMAFYIRELRRQETNRAEMALDQEFYDGNQWSDEDARVLRDRGQVPIVYNVLKPTLDIVIGTEKRSRTQFKVLPRGKEDARAAELKTQLLKYLQDVNRSQFSKSSAFEDASKVGVGWLETGVQADDDGEPVYTRYESWRNMLWDSASVEKDMSDCRYMTRSKWVDVDIANALFPDRRGMIEQSAIESDRFLMDASHGDIAMDTMEIADSMYRSDQAQFAYKRLRLRLIEIWYRAPAKVKKVVGGPFNGQIYDEAHPGQAEQVRIGRSTIITKTMMRMHVAIMTIKGLLFVSQSPYRHNDFPFTPIWCYRRGSNGLPYGIIRGLRDIQTDVNKRASKALHILSTSKTVMDEGAVPDLDAFMEEVSRPDAVIVKKQGKDLTITADRDLAPAHMELMSRDIQMIQSVSGITDEYMGRETNAKSGVAIQARQNQGSLATAALFDNLRFAMQVHGEKELSLVEQFFTEEKQFRITNMRGTPEYIVVNDGLPENDIIRTKADFIISEDDWRNTMRQAQTEELMMLMSQLAPVNPQIPVIMLDLLVEGMDIPNREEIVNRIRQATGMRDPDAEEPTPQEIAKAQAEAEAAEMQKAMFAAEIADKQASAAQKQAAAAKVAAEVNASAQRLIAELANKNVSTQKAALETALAMIASPVIVPVADGVLHEAGFKSRTEKEDDAMLAEAMQRKADQDQARQMAAEQQAQQQAQAQQPQGQPMPPA